MMLADVGAVAIGRNEGERLERCLASLVGRVASVVYVDSGSTDGSVARARAMGCEVGRRTIVTQPMQCFDWNAVSFGSECVIDGVLQLHSFENMLLKVSRTRIEDGCTVSFGATVMGGALIERDTTVLPLSLVLKEMKLVTGTYEGSPAEPVDAARQLAAKSLLADIAT